MTQGLGVFLHGKLTVFQKLNAREEVSINLYTLTLDWLFLIGAINKTSKGDLQKCF